MTTANDSTTDAFTAWQLAQGDPATVTIAGEEVVAAPTARTYSTGDRVVVRNLMGDEAATVTGAIVPAAGELQTYTVAFDDGTVMGGIAEVATEHGYIVRKAHPTEAGRITAEPTTHDEAVALELLERAEACERSSEEWVRKAYDHTAAGQADDAATAYRLARLFEGKAAGIREALKALGLEEVGA